jgi:hypothetical protein
LGADLCEQICTKQNLALCVLCSLCPCLLGPGFGFEALGLCPGLLGLFCEGFSSLFCFLEWCFLGGLFGAHASILEVIFRAGMPPGFPTI